MRVLLDTHSLLWLVANDPQASPTARATFLNAESTRTNQTLSVGLSLAACAALRLALQVGIDSLRRMSEQAAAEQRIALIGKLQDLGYERQAPVIVERLFQDIRERPAEDPVLQRLLDLPPR